MRIFSFILLAGLTILLLGCGPSDSGQEALGGGTVPASTETPSGTVAPPVVSVTPTTTATQPVAVDTPTATAIPAVATGTPTTTATQPVGTPTPSGGVAPPAATNTPTPGVVRPLSVPPPPYDGPRSLEERIFASPVIARVRLDSVSSVAESGSTYQGEKYLALLEFSFSVQEYLKGSGADDIVAVWAAAPFFDTREEAEAALPSIVATRDSQWDDRETIVFLQQDFQEFLPSTQQANRYYLAWGGGLPMYALDDGYSIASRHNKLWLPASAAVGAPSQPTGDQQRILMDVLPATGTAPNITLGEIKTKIAGVTAKLNAGDGSEEYTECVRETYYIERRNRHLREKYPDREHTGTNISPPHVHQFDSGLAGDTVVYEIPEGDTITPGAPFEAWLDDGDASLFSVASPSQDYRMTTTRPLPGGTYNFYFNHRGSYYSRCDGWAIRYEWTVTVNSPAGTLHEAFFDPVTDGTAVAADDSNGVLKPAMFTDANGASATLERIAWEPGTGGSGTVKLQVNPPTGLTDQEVNFIALDGSVSLSLQVANATVDAANRTLSWAVDSQPWQSGDQLMLRIREDG